MNNEKMQEEFENWAKSKGYSIGKFTFDCLVSKKGDYCGWKVRQLWEGWQAARENIDLPYMYRPTPVRDVQAKGYNNAIIDCKDVLKDQGLTIKNDEDYL